MKIWYGYGSEHSMNLVMIGQFEDAADAAKANQVIERLKKQVEADVQAGSIEVGKPTNRFPDAMLKLLMEMNLSIIGPSELEQFAYDIAIKVEDRKVIVTTDEADVSALLKVLVELGARVEVYSAHSYPGTGFGRGG